MTSTTLPKLLLPLGQGAFTVFAYMAGTAVDNMVIHETGTSMDLKVVLALGAAVFFIGKWMQKQTDDIKHIKIQMEALSKQLSMMSKKVVQAYGLLGIFWISA